LDKLSLISLITVSLPDAIMIALIGLLSIGKFSYFKNKFNYVKIAIFAILSSTALYFIRPIVSDLIEQLIVGILLYSLLFIFILGLKFYESILAGLIGMIILVLIEAFYVPSLLSITRLKIEEVFNNDFNRFLYSSPERVIELVIVYISLRFKLKIFDFDKTNIKKIDYYVQIFTSLLSIATLVFLVAVITKTLLFDRGNIVNSTTMLLLRLNVFISLFVIVILLLAIKNINEYHEKKNMLNNNEFRQNLDYISDLINEKKFEEVKESIAVLKSHIGKL